MADIPLRTYVQQLDNLIERKQVDEVVAHCRHILGLYPKHLDTYRMLGKALLEKGRHGDAADIFQRVLSVMPDDFISHVGMSIVREDEANLDAAIWHMERAFESAPANGAIQQELCRLFGRRDGVVPAKARLTRGALARMYAQGGLYLQAEAELKAALAAEADRIDLMTKLADVYWQTDQPAQAAQTSAAVLQKLPYSLEANRILVNVFRAQGRANDAVVYRQRLEALDPYEAFADPVANGAGAARVDPAKVAVSRLEYVAGMEDSGSPDWLASIGAKFEEPASSRAPEAQPDWLSAAGENAPSAVESQAYQPGQGSVPDWLKDLDSGPAAMADAQTSAPPDWLKDMGTTTQPSAAPSESTEALPDWLVTATGPLPADSVPDWMLQGSTAASTEADEIATGPLTPSEAAGTLAGRVQAESADVTQVGAGPATPLAPIEPTGEVPNWLKTTAADEPEEELPDWLKAITVQPLPEAQPPAAIAEAAAADSIAAGQIPDWLQTAAPENATTAATPPVTSDHVPAWLQTAASTPPDTGPLPDWLKAATGELDPKIAGQAPPPEAGATEPAAAAALQQPEVLAAEATTAAEMPAAAELPATTDQAQETAGVASLADLPDWPADVAPTEQASVPTAAGEAIEPPLAVEAGILAVATGSLDTQPAEIEAAMPDLPGGEELPDWLKTAAAVPAQDETPVWLQTAPAMPGLAATQADHEPEVVIPDWLRDLAGGAAAADSGQAPLGELGLTGGTETPKVEGAPSVPAVELPDFLQLASPAAIARAEQPVEMEPDEMEPEEDEPAAAVPAEIPEWLKALAPASAETESPVSQVPEPVDSNAPAGASLEDSLSWMDELTAAAGPTGGAAAGEPAAEEPPAWLAAPTTLASAETAPAEAADLVAGGLGEDTLSSEIPPWAQNQEPGPSDTIVSWLAGKHVPDWLRQPANEAPGLPAVEWEPNAAEPATQPVAVDSLAAAASEPPAPPEMAQAAAPDLESMDPEAAFRWLEGLAAKQGANPEELFTAPAEPTMAQTESFAAEPVLSAAEHPTLETQALATPAPEPAAVANEAAVPEAGSLEDFLKQTEAAMPVEHLLDTAPSKLKPPVEAASTPAAEIAPEAGLEPASADAELRAGAAEGQPEPSSADFDSDAAMRWLEGLAAKQGANPEELLTAPEERTLEAPQWVAAEQAAAAQAPEPAPAAPVVVEAAVDEVTTEVTHPPAAEAVAAQPATAMAEVESAAVPAEAAAAVPEAPVVSTAAEALSPDAEADAAMRWLEGLATQQGANPEELITAPEERTLEAPAWVSASVEAAGVADTVAATPEASPFEAVAPETAAGTHAEITPAEAEPEPSTAAVMPERLEALAPVEEKSEATPAPLAEPSAAATPAEAAEPPDSGAGADLDKLSRLAERLGAARRIREAEMEARFAEQRNQQEAARRWVEERLEAKQTEPEPGPAPDIELVTSPAPEAAAVEAAAVSPAQAQEAPAAAAAAGASRLRPRPSLRGRRPRPTPVAVSPAPAPAIMPAAAAEALAHGQAALAGQDYATAVTHLTVLVEQGHHLDTVVQSLEDAAGSGRAPAPMLRLLGDAYVRTDQLQKALDTYRQALRRL